MVKLDAWEGLFHESSKRRKKKRQRKKSWEKHVKKSLLWEVITVGRNLLRSDNGQSQIWDSRFVSSQLFAGHSIATTVLLRGHEAAG